MPFDGVIDFRLDLAAPERGLLTNGFYVSCPHSMVSPPQEQLVSLMLQAVLLSLVVVSQHLPHLSWV